MTERIEGLSIGLGLDDVELQRGLTGLKDRLKTVNAEMKNNLSAFDRGEKSVDKYATILGGLNEKIKVQEKIVKSSRAEYEKMVSEHGKGSVEAEKAKRAYENQSATLNNLQRSAQRTGDELAALQKEQDKANSNWGEFSENAKKVGDSLTGIGDKMKGAGSALTAGLTVPLLGFGGLLLKSAADVESSQTRIQNVMGLTTDEAKKMSGIVTDVYKDGWGESLESVEAAAVAVVEKIGMLDSPEQLNNAIKKATMLEETFGSDMNESLRGVNALMETFGLSSDEAFDYMVAGAQGGLDFTDELGDNLAEYSPLLKDAGYEAGEMFDALQAGVDAGAYNLDKVNDLLKEFAIRVGDDTIKTKVADMGGEWQSLYDTWEASGGSVDDLFRLLGNHLATIQDPQEKQLALSELWGSLGEDNGAKVVEAVAAAEAKYEDLNGAADGVIKKQEETFGEKSQRLMRQSADALLPLGNQLLELADEHMPKLEDAVEGVVDWLGKLDEDSIKTGLSIAGIAMLAGPTLSLLGSATTVIGGMATGFGKISASILNAGGVKAAMTAFGGSLNSALLTAGPWVLGIGAIIGAGVLLVNHLKEDAIPATGDFGDKVSEETARAVNGFMDLSKDATAQLDYLFYAGAEITDEGAAELTGKFDSMFGTIKTAMEENLGEQLTALGTFFAETGGKTDEHETELLNKVRESYNNRKTELEAYNAEAAGIIATANEENRELTQAEHDRLAFLNTTAQQLAIVELSESEQEQLVIKEQMRIEKGAIDAQTAAETVKQSASARDGSIADANQTYDEVVAAAIFQRDETGVLSAEEADNIIREAGRQRDQAIADAKKMHTDVVTEAKDRAGEHVNSVNWETGEVLNKFETMKNQTVAKTQDLGRQMKDNFNQQIKEHRQAFDGFVDFIKGVPGRMGEAFNNEKHKFGTHLAGFMNAGLMSVRNGVNGIIKGVNWVFEKLDSDTELSYWYPKHIVYAYKNGTDGHPGGPAIVGDGGMKELIVFPNGETALSPDTDTLMDMPKGTQVLSGPKTKKLMNSMGIPKYEDGIGSKVFEWLADGAKNLLGKALESLGISKPSGDGTFGKIAGSVFDLIKNKAFKFIEGKTEDLFSAFSGSVGPAGNVGNWKPMILRAAAQMGQSVSAREISGILAQIQRESGGNQKIVQSSAVWDINTASGNPARGLLQYIPQTFAAYNVPGFGDIYNGYHQLLAFFNNTNWRRDLPYGNSGWGPSGGTRYATGGLVGHGMYELGEEGYPEWIIPTDPSRRTDAMKLLALAGQQIGNKRPDDMPSPSGTTNQEGDTYNVYVTVEGNSNLSQSAIDKMAQQITKSIKREENMRKQSRGGAVGYA